MKKDTLRLTQLLAKDHLTPDEKNWLNDYLQKRDTEELGSILQQQFEAEAGQDAWAKDHYTEKVLANIHKRIAEPAAAAERPARVTPLWMKFAAAAAVLVLSVFGLRYFQRPGQEQLAKVHPHIFKHDIPAGSERATLTLANGTTVDLKASANGVIATQGGARVVKSDGKLYYKTTERSAGLVQFNTVTTPRGGRYSVTLPDGSLVWLNAASSIRYPTAFNGKERRVEISGEAYFEIAKDKTKAFIVSTNGSEVKVFGTHFNVMAYPEEGMIKTTLLEGSVQFSGAGGQVMLEPGQQAQARGRAAIKVLRDLDTADEIAWKNGLFHFEDSEIHTVMRQISRWYNVDIVYQKIPQARFYADVPSRLNVSEVLKALELTGKVRFEVEANKIIVQ